jgi:hypothetical protein
MRKRKRKIESKKKKERKKKIRAESKNIEKYSFGSKTTRWGVEIFHQIAKRKI